MQCFAPAAPEAAPAPDRLDLVHLVGFGAGREAENLPRLLREDMADEVVLVQPLHDNDDRAVPLVVEAAVKGVIVPCIGTVSLRCGERLVGLQRVIDDDGL